jgi:hypothetical protein
MDATHTDTDTRQGGRQGTYEEVYTYREGQHAQGTSLSHRLVDWGVARRMTNNMNGRCRILLHALYVLLE